MKGNLLPFIDLKSRLERILHDRVAGGKGNNMTIFADAACCLSENQSFTESENLECWWQQAHDEWIRVGQHITVIYPHPEGILNCNLRAKAGIGNQHDLILNFESYLSACNQIEKVRILVAEPEADLRDLYLDYLGMSGADFVVTESGSDCLLAYKENEFDIVILDTHLRDKSALTIAKEIRAIRPDQNIAVTTTNSLDRIFFFFQSQGINTENILLKPFLLSSLLRLIRKNKSIIN
ncbi:MAG TPA: response regulator [Nitrososphaeraceae archaeon]